MIGGDRFTINFHRVRIHKAGKAFDDFDFVFAQHVVIRGVNAIDIGAAVLYQRGPVKAVHRSIKAVIGSIQMNGFGDLCRMPHHFFGHATDVNAGATQLFRFDQRTRLAVHGCTINGGDAAAAAADSEVVKMSGHPLFPSVEKIWRKVYRYLAERRKGPAYDYDRVKSRFRLQVRLLCI